MPAATRTRLTPTSLVPAARPSICQVASISPFARWCCSTSSQWAIATLGIYGFETSTVNEPRPDTRSTFSFNAR